MRLIQIGYTCHECADFEYFETDLTDEQVEDAIVEAARGLKVWDLDALIDDEALGFFDRLKELGVVRKITPVDKVFRFDGWQFSAPLYSNDALSNRIAAAVCRLSLNDSGELVER
ncbi:MAG: hypothetical protein BWY68_00308 [bacterium ADurb.Bin400]|nr:MAG: hypothetical protein BWY68_00308 [bacterium ADurb.Bin400]